MFGLVSFEFTGARQLLEENAHSDQMPDNRTGHFILTLPETGATK